MNRPERTPAPEWFERHGFSVATPDSLLDALRTALETTPTALYGRSSSELTDAERDALRAGGVDFDRPLRKDPLEGTIALFAALIESSLSVKETAERLAVQRVEEIDLAAALLDADHVALRLVQHQRALEDALEQRAGVLPAARRDRLQRLGARLAASVDELGEQRIERGIPDRHLGVRRARAEERREHERREGEDRMTGEAIGRVAATDPCRYDDGRSAHAAQRFWPEHSPVTTL